MASDKPSRDGNDPSKNPFRNGMLPGYAGKGAANGRKGPAAFAGNNAAADNDPLDPQKIIAGLLRYKWIILLATLLGGVAAWFYADFQTPRYRTSGTILIHVESGMPYLSDGNIGSMLTRNLGLGNGRTLENQLEVLRSVSFATRVAGVVMDKRTMGNGEPHPILFSEEEPFEELDRDQIANRVLQRTEVERVNRDVDILSVRHESTDPREAMEMANLMLEEYVALTSEQSRSSIRATLVYLEDIMLDEVQERLARSEQEVEAFMQEVQGGINLPEHTSRLIDRMSELDQRIEMMEVDREAIGQQRAALEAELDEIRPGLAEQIKSASSARVEMIQRNMANLSIERMLLLNQNPGLRGNEQAEPRLREINRDLDHLRAEIDELISSKLEGAPDYLMGEPADISMRIAELRRMLTEQQVELFRLNALQERARTRLAEFEEQLDRLPEQ
ncbi:GumC family protein, partial [Thioalkalivibrio sp.]|uniref:GumC family protein n=1 Tax=Thioalkalivibrio sp. TaxID=2093813 RepID=UPI0039764C4A